MHNEFLAMSKRYLVDLLQQVRQITTLPAELRHLPLGDPTDTPNYEDMLCRIACNELPGPAERTELDKIELGGLLRQGIVVQKHEQVTIPVRLLGEWLREYC